MTTTQNNTIVRIQTYARELVEHNRKYMEFDHVDYPRMEFLRGEIMFWSFLHNRNRRKALKWHRKLHSSTLNYLTHEMREDVLEDADTCSYWAHVPIQ